MPVEPSRTRRRSRPRRSRPRRLHRSRLRRSRRGPSQDLRGWSRKLPSPLPRLSSRAARPPRRNSRRFLLCRLPCMKPRRTCSRRRPLRRSLNLSRLSPNRTYIRPSCRRPSRRRPSPNPNRHRASRSFRRSRSSMRSGQRKRHLKHRLPRSLLPSRRLCLSRSRRRPLPPRKSSAPRSSNQAWSMAWVTRSISTVRSRPNCRRAPCGSPRSMNCALIWKRTQGRSAKVKSSRCCPKLCLAKAQNPPVTSK